MLAGKQTKTMDQHYFTKMAITLQQRVIETTLIHL